ncbi:3582_t:CDS:2, partial [Gigaspora rosea]
PINAITIGKVLKEWARAQAILLLDFAEVERLELAHAFGRMIEVLVGFSGASIGCFRENVLSIIDDIVELKPTIFPSVPRLLTRVSAKLQQNI